MPSDHPNFCGPSDVLPYFLIFFLSCQILSKPVGVQDWVVWSLGFENNAGLALFITHVRCCLLHFIRVQDIAEMILEKFEIRDVLALPPDLVFDCFFNEANVLEDVGDIIDSPLLHVQLLCCLVEVN